MLDVFCLKDKYHPGAYLLSVENIKHAAVICSRPWKAEAGGSVSYSLSNALRQAFTRLC